MTVRIITVYWFNSTYEEIADITNYLIKSYDPSLIYERHSLRDNWGDFGSLKAYTVTEENANFLLIKYPQYVKLHEKIYNVKPNKNKI